MSATIVLRSDIYSVNTPLSINEVMQQLGLETESYLVMRNGELIDAEEFLDDDDIVQLIPVIAGG